MLGNRTYSITSATPEHCHHDNLDDLKDTTDLGLVMQDLMESGHTQDAIALRHPDKWSLDAQDFLRKTLSARPAELRNVYHLSPRMYVSRLTPLASMVTGCSTSL